MKKHIFSELQKFSIKSYLILAILLAFVLLLLSAALAPSRVHAQSAPAPTPSGSSFEQRVAQRKAERKIVLDDRTQRRQVSLCVGAQGKIRALQQKTTPALVNRARVNQQIDAKLW